MELLFLLVVVTAPRCSLALTRVTNIFRSLGKMLANDLGVLSYSFNGKSMDATKSSLLEKDFRTFLILRISFIRLSTAKIFCQQVDDGELGQELHTTQDLTKASVRHWTKLQSIQ